jgi:hypothetical protein
LDIAAKFLKRAILHAPKKNEDVQMTQPPELNQKMQPRVIEEGYKVQKKNGRSVMSSVGI